MRRKAVRDAAVKLADEQGGVISRSQLIASGVTRWQIAAELRAMRWRGHGRQTLAVHTGDLSELAQWWRAVFEVGAGAALDGVTALTAAGLSGFTEVVHISIPKSGRPRRAAGVVVHETRRRQPDDVLESGPPRVRSAVAAIRGALWAKSDKQAALILAMCVQQRLATVESLVLAFESVRRHRRRRLIRGLLGDLAGGAQSIGELEFAELCREYGLPEPDRQTRRVTQHGIVYVDNEWSEYNVFVEIDGAHHAEVGQAVADSVRQNELTIERAHVLRIPTLGLRTNPELYLGQVARMLEACGWSPPRSLMRPKERAS